MRNLPRKPIGFLLVSLLLLSVLSIFDYFTFHFLVDIFTVFIGFMIFIIVLNSKLYKQKSIFLVLSVSYLFVSSVDLVHLITFFNIGNFDSTLNQSFALFASARVFEVSSIFFLFSFVRKFNKPNYLVTQIVGAVVFVIILGTVFTGSAAEFYVEGMGTTSLVLIINYITGALFVVIVFLVHKSNMNLTQRKMLMIIFILKAASQLLHAHVCFNGDIVEVLSMLIRFISYVGLYIVFISEIVANPYSNVYEMFKTKEDELLTLSQRDSLTGIYNHSLTFQNIEGMIQNLGSKYHDLCVILFDIDNFKQINDSFGHIKGDEMLIAFTSLLDNLDYKDRMLGRYGGDEFVLAIPNCTEDDIHKIFMTLNGALLEIAEKTGVLITFSSGVVFWHMGDNATDLIRKADIKMYESKNKGKNQYTIWQTDYSNKK